MIDRRKSLITPKKTAENRNGLQDDTGGRASWQSGGRAAGAVTTILAPAIIWQGPFGPRHVDSFRTPAINRQTVSQGFLAKIYHFWMNGWSFSTYESYIKIWCRYRRELWQHLEGFWFASLKIPLVTPHTIYIRNVSYASMVLKRWGKF